MKDGEQLYGNTKFLEFLKRKDLTTDFVESLQIGTPPWTLKCDLKFLSQLVYQERVWGKNSVHKVDFLRISSLALLGFIFGTLKRT